LVFSKKTIGVGSGLTAGFAPARVPVEHVMAEATTLATSARSTERSWCYWSWRIAEGRDVELGHLEVAACRPPSFPIASATTFTAARVASATRAAPSPRPRLVDRRLLLAFRSEDRRLLLAFGEVDSCCFSPRFGDQRALFFSAVICACIARRIHLGGVKFFTS